MENKIQSKKQNVIVLVEKGSIAEEIGISVGDILVSVNEKEITDVFDYRYLINDEYVEICIESPDGGVWIAEVEKEFDEDIGIAFENGLMDKAKSCRNKCIFCFIDQLPPNMRETLYFKDDDSRLSFLQGNYVTLTNMSEKDIDRILYYHLSPINISVHTTHLELRKKMLKNKNADKILELMKKIADAGVEMNLQVVLCKGINDGEILDKTIEDCAMFFPNARSMSVVPIGLTKYRNNLHPMKSFDEKDCNKVLDKIEFWQKKLKYKLGTNFVFASDEFYLKANRVFPPIGEYEDFSQYENGVGMICLLEDEFNERFKNINYTETNERTISIGTGKAAFKLINSISERFMLKYPRLKIYVYNIRNDFFGEEITVSGLLTGTDIINQLKGKELGEYLLLPDSILRNETTILLDDFSIEDIEKALNVKIKIVKNSGMSLIKNILNTEEI